MLKRIRKRITYANVGMTVALVFALSGGAYAAASSMPGRDGVIRFARRSLSNLTYLPTEQLVEAIRATEV